MRMFHTTIKIIALQPYRIYLSGWEFSDKVTLTDKQAEPFVNAGFKKGDWLSCQVNLEAINSEGLVFTNIELDPRPTPTDEEFLAKYPEV